MLLSATLNYSVLFLLVRHFERVAKVKDQFKIIGEFSQTAGLFLLGVSLECLGVRRGSMTSTKADGEWGACGRERNMFSTVMCWTLSQGSEGLPYSQ